MKRAEGRFASVLVELGWLHDAELTVAHALDDDPDDLEALSLFAKIKHMLGDLSSAIGCWAQIHANSPYNEFALMQLRSLLQLAEDPERGAGEFLVLGQYQLARKPVAQLSLEEAFRLFHARQPDDARARCVEIAHRYRSEDPQLYKLAVLANAWIAELSGDLADARDVLEQLGRERGFERDVDRLLGLVRIYEKLGTDETLESAVKICRYIERELQRTGTRKVSLLSRLAALYRRLGETDLARTYERRHLDAFRERMHRPSFRDVVAVAAERYLPLAGLQAIRFSSRAFPASASLRERALAAALQGERDQARAAFADGGELLDRKYIADLAALAGDDAAAERAYLSTLDDDPDDMQVVGWLLAHVDGAPSAQVAQRFSEPEFYFRTRDNLQAAIMRAPLRPSLWSQLGVLHRLRNEDDDADRCDERARVMTVAATERSQPVGRVLSAGVYHFLGTARGLIHEVWVHRQPVEPGKGGALPSDQVLGNLTPELKQGVRNTFLAVREYARTKFPAQTSDLADYDYSFKVPKEDEPSGGLSAGLPCALAFLSVFLQRPLPQTLAMTGILVTDSHTVMTVRKVGDVDHKIMAAYHRNLHGIILPTANGPELEQSAAIPAEVREEMVRYATNLDDAVKLVWGDRAFVED